MSLLDQLRARHFVLDQNDCRVEEIVLVLDCAFEVRIGELLAQDVDEIKVGSFKAPGRADRVIGKFAGAIGCVPALGDLVEPLRQLARFIALEPGLPNEAAPRRCRELLILAREIIASDRSADLLEGPEGFAFRLKGFADKTAEA
jgi:hypothetical protein